MKHICCSLLLLVSLSGSAQLVNADFESWYPDNNLMKLTGWEHLMKYELPNTILVGTWQTTNAQQNTYALILSRWYNYTWDVVRQKAPINTSPLAVTGYYRYTETDLVGVVDKDTATVSVYLTRWNSGTLQPDTLAYGLRDLGFTNTYTAFSCPITYMQSGQPDSITVHITPSKFAGIGTSCADSNYCSFLYVDNLALSGTTGIHETAGKSIAIYPNPVTDQLYIKDLEENGSSDASITDITGRTITRFYVSGTSIVDTRSWSPGLYFIQVKGRQHTFSYRIIKR
jgi:hypothetical protein